MSSYLTSATLIESVKRRSHMPESQVTFLDDDLLAFANEEMQIGLVPCVMKMHEEFLVYPQLVPLIANVSNYPIPSRAIGSKVREVFYLDQATNLREMARILPENLAFFQNSSSLDYPRAFYLENNDIVLVPKVTQSPMGQLLFKYYMRPNQLVSADRISTVVSIDTVNGDITVDQVPSIFNTSEVFDILQTGAAHKTLSIDLTPTSINGTTKVISFDPANLPRTLAIGDMIALAGETMIPQVPDELHSVLAQRVACRCFEAQKDLDGLQAANMKLQEMEVNLGILIDNRTEGQPQKVNNLRGALRMGKFRRRRSTW